MKTIVTMTVNPAIDKSLSVTHVVAERKLYCSPSLVLSPKGRSQCLPGHQKLGGESLLLYPDCLVG